MSIVHVLQNKTSKHSIIMSMVHHMVVTAMLHNINFYAAHIPGRHNIITDLLSHFQVQKAKKRDPWVDHEQTVIPRRLLLWSNIRLA